VLARDGHWFGRPGVQHWIVGSGRSAHLVAGFLPMQKSSGYGIGNLSESAWRSSAGFPPSWRIGILHRAYPVLRGAKSLDGPYTALTHSEQLTANVNPAK
jgi:hypothetical protein